MVDRAGPACAALVALLLTAWIYWPGIAGPDMLDDRSSLQVLQDLQENPERAWDYVFGDRSGPLGRTVSMATFVLEKLYLDNGFAGHKRVNILLHLANGVLVMWLFGLLFRAWGVRRHGLLAVALGAVWLLHPLQVSTVLYAVQRMAMLSAFFVLLCLISYLYWRRGAARDSAHPVGLLPVVVFFVAGMLSKENTIVALPILLLMEVLWLQCRDRDGRLIPWLRSTVYLLMAAGAVAAVVLFFLGLDYLQGKYLHRPYSLGERLLTQARIVWDYVFQWFAPQVTRMGLYHDDIAWSTALTAPATTLYAVLGWLLVALCSLVLLRWPTGRKLVFAMAVFLAGHVVESTVWPLELYFEHRNYLPVVGLLLAVGVAFGAITRRWPEPASPLLVILGVWALGMAMFTSAQVTIWSSRPLLILHHINGHPDSPRANIDMAAQLARLGSWERASVYSRHAFEVSTTEREGDWRLRDLALKCLTRTPVEAREYTTVGAADSRRPLSSVTTLLTLVRMLQDDACPGFDRERFADHMAGIYLGERPAATGSVNIYANFAVLENALQRYDLALAYTEKLLALAPTHRRGLLMQLHFATALGRDDVAQGVIATLQELDRQGNLTEQQRQTLALYLEN